MPLFIEGICLGCIMRCFVSRSRKGMLSLSTGTEAMPVGLCQVLGSPGRETWTRRRDGSKDTEMIKGLEHFFYEERLRKLKLFSLKTGSERDIVIVYKYLKGGFTVLRLFSVVLNDRTRSNGHKGKHRCFCMNIRKYFITVRVTALPQIDHGSYGVSILGDIQDPSVHGSVKLAQGVPA